MGVYQTKMASFAIGLGLAPPLAVLILLVTNVINGETLRKGIIGADGIEPLNIMALFISLAVGGPPLPLLLLISM